MNKPYHMKLIAEGLEGAVIRGEFSDTEYDVLSAFLQEYEVLLQSKPLREGFPCHIELKGANGRLHVTAQLPTSDDLAILLHRLRPFVLEGEPASFARAGSILKRHGTNPHLRHLLRYQQRLYDGRDMQQQMIIRVNDLVVNSESVLKQWLNAGEYHRDADKRRAVEQLLQGMPGDLVRGIFVSLLVDKLKAIHSRASLIALMLGNIEELFFSSTAPPGASAR